MFLTRLNNSQYKLEPEKLVDNGYYLFIALNEKVNKRQLIRHIVIYLKIIVKKPFIFKNYRYHPKSTQRSDSTSQKKFTEASQDSQSEKQSCTARTSIPQ